MSQPRFTTTPFIAVQETPDHPGLTDLHMFGGREGNLNLRFYSMDLLVVKDRVFEVLSSDRSIRMKVDLVNHQRVLVSLTRRGVTTLHQLSHPKWGLIFLPLVAHLKRIQRTGMIDEDYQGGGL